MSDVLTPAALLDLADRLAGQRVLCVGDAMLDLWVQGSVARISPEAPVPVLRVSGRSQGVGGAGNVARNLAVHGVGTTLLSVTGDDTPGRDVAALLAQEPHLEPHLLVDTQRPTAVKTRFVAQGQQVLRVDEEQTTPLSDDLVQAIGSTLAESATQHGALILSDYGKGVLGPGVLAAVRDAMAHHPNLPVVVDPKGQDYSRYRGATVVTPNRKELAEATGMPVHDDAAVETAARALMAASGIKAVLATRAEEGMTLVEGDRPAVHLPAHAREVYDVSGAGDTVVALLAAGLAAGASLAQAAQLANLAAGVVVGKRGTAVVMPGELRSAIMHDSHTGPGVRVLSRTEALERAASWREQGLRVGFTNGCFDLLHPGHVSLLTQARAACDRLIVGLNSDASVARLKGPSRPVQREGDRAVVLASLAMVDAVVLFEEDTPLALIEALRPAVLVKGADYTEDQVVGAPLVRAYGGEVVLAKLVEGQSTTGTIAKLKA